MKETDKAIFLHRIHFSESSLIVTFYTFRNGLQKFIFQGGKKKPSGLFPLSLSEINYYRRPDSDLGKVTTVQPYHMLHQLTGNPLKSTIAFFIGDVLKQCLQTDQSDPRLFYFVEQQIILLDAEEEVSLFALKFLLQFAEHMGIDPSLEVVNKKYFYLQDGEFSDSERKGEIVSNQATAELIQELLRSNKTEGYPKETKQETLETLLLYYKLHIPKFDVQKSLEIVRDILYT